MRLKKSLHLQAITIFFIAFWFNSCQPPEDKLSKDIPEVSKSRNAKLLSCFFGLDNNMPDKAAVLWKEAPGKDGMPIIFSHEIDPLTLNIAAFKITTKNGTIYYPQFATFKPANEEYEMRTILLIGEFGNSPVNPPVKVEIVKDLKTRGRQSLKGQTLAVTPLEDGPFISYAEYFYLDKEGYPYVANGRGCDCPKKETNVVVRMVWAGGVVAMNGQELGKNELKNFTVT